MIASAISQKSHVSNNFKALATYVLRAHSGIPRQTTIESDTVAWAKAINCASPHLDLAVTDAAMTQQVNRRAETCKSYHYVVSFPAGEQPAREILENIEKVLSTAIGYGAHQRLVAVHRDTPNLHMHVVVNRVHPETFKCIGTVFDHYTLQRAAAELEDIHGLVKDNHMPGSRIRDREPFRPAWQTDPPPSAKRDPDLQAAFRQARDAAARARRQALLVLRAQHQAYFRKLVAWHAQRRANARATRLSRADRKSSNLALREAAQNDHAARKQREGWEREQVRKQYPVLTWEAFNDQRVAREAMLAAERSAAVRVLHGLDKAPPRAR